MEIQEAFDIAYKGLSAQNWEKSETKITIFKDRTQTVCAYRGDNGRKCAVGHLIPDSSYKKEMEGTGVGHIVGHYNLVELSPVLLQEFCSHMQSLHDTSIGREDMKERFEGFALERGLTIPE